MSKQPPLSRGEKIGVVLMWIGVALIPVVAWKHPGFVDYMAAWLGGPFRRN